MTPVQRNELTNSEVEILRQNGKKLILVPGIVMNKIDRFEQQKLK